MLDLTVPPTTAHAARTIIGNLRDYSPTLSKADLFDAMERVLSEQRGNIYEKMVELYVNGRMRTIHGLYAPILYEKNVMMYIGSKKLLLAARMLPFIQWGRGDAPMDIILSCDPELAFFPIDGKPYLTEAMKKRYPIRYALCKLFLNRKIKGDSGWSAAREKELVNIKSAQVKTVIKPHTWEWIDETQRLYHRLIGFDKRFYDVLCPELMTKLLEIVASDGGALKYDTPESYSRKVYAKLCSYDDQIALSANNIFD